MSLTSYDLPTSSVEDTLHLIATYLESITKTNDQIPHDMVTPYHARSIPSISIAAYLNRIHHFCPATNEAYLAALIYLQRATKLGLEHDATYILMDSYSIHRLLITSIMVGAKFFCDLFYTNCRYAKVGGVPVDELNKLEVEFLKLTQFEFTVQPDELQRLGDDLTQFYDYFTLTPPLSGSSTFSSVPNSPLIPVLSSANLCTQWKNLPTAQRMPILLNQTAISIRDRITLCSKHTKADEDGYGLKFSIQIDSGNHLNPFCSFGHWFQTIPIREMIGL